jgi:hypothetical protein
MNLWTRKLLKKDHQKGNYRKRSPLKRKNLKKNPLTESRQKKNHQKKNHLKNLLENLVQIDLMVESVNTFFMYNAVLICF